MEVHTQQREAYTQQMSSDNVDKERCWIFNDDGEPVLAYREETVPKPRRKRRSAQDIALQRASRRSLAHQERWKVMSEEQKEKILANLAVGREKRTKKYSKK